MDATPLASRRAAVDVLMACLDKGQPLDDALAGHRGFTALDPRDRAFVRLLLATTVRHLGEIGQGGAHAQVIEFDLALTQMNEKRLDKIWLDLILEKPAMNAAMIREMIFSRHLRANV